MERIEAHRILTGHLAERDRRWLWLRYRCANCGGRYPCASRTAALAELTAGIPNRAPLAWIRRLRQHLEEHAAQAAAARGSTEPQ
jgi:hypothetical protein